MLCIRSMQSTVLGSTVCSVGFAIFLAIRKKLINDLLTDKPDIYIGIDAPDFNLRVERELHQAGIPTVQYVAPSIWAWRGYRIRKIKQAVSRILTIYPFESTIYERAEVPFAYVGHPLADENRIVVDAGCEKKV